MYEMSEMNENGGGTTHNNILMINYANFCIYYLRKAIFHLSYTASFLWEHAKKCYVTAKSCPNFSAIRDDHFMHEEKSISYNA